MMHTSHNQASYKLYPTWAPRFLGLGTSFLTWAPRICTLLMSVRLGELSALLGDTPEEGEVRIRLKFTNCPGKKNYNNFSNF